MFTGIIEHMGRVSAIDPLDTSASGGGGWSMTLADCAPVLGDCHVGDSIAVDGACLTVTEFAADAFKVGLAPETLQRTNLGKLTVGDYVNLERAMGAHTRFGGHFVQGHVDSIATIISRTPDENSLRLLFQLPEEGASLLPYLIPKGFVAIDGTSLTLTSVSDADRTFGVMLIAHTQSKVTLAKKPVGGTVNIEVDMVGKYVEKSVAASLGGEAAGGVGLRGLVEKTVEDVLKKRGIL